MDPSSTEASIEVNEQKTELERLADSSGYILKVKKPSLKQSSKIPFDDSIAVNARMAID